MNYQGRKLTIMACTIINSEIDELKINIIKFIKIGYKYLVLKVESKVKLFCLFFNGYQKGNNDINLNCKTFEFNRIGVM